MWLGPAGIVDAPARLSQAGARSARHSHWPMRRSVGGSATALACSAQHASTHMKCTMQRSRKQLAPMPGCLRATEAKQPSHVRLPRCNAANASQAGCRVGCEWVRVRTSESARAVHASHVACRVACCMPRCMLHAALHVARRVANCMLCRADRRIRSRSSFIACRASSPISPSPLMGLSSRRIPCIGLPRPPPLFRRALSASRTMYLCHR